MPGLTYVLTDLAGDPVGELTNVRGKSVHLAFNGRPKTASGTIRLDNPLADPVLEASVRLKAYDARGVLQLNGRLDSAEEVNDGGGNGSVQFVFADEWALLTDRLIGKSTGGYDNGTALSPKDKSELVADVIAEVNGEQYTGIDVTWTNAGSSGYLATTPYKPAAEAILELVNQLDGPDIELVAQEPAAVAGGTRVGLLNVAAAIGQARPNVVFEYGTNKRNVASYRRAVTGRAVNRLYGLPSAAGADVSGVLSSQDGPSQAEYGLREAAISSDLPATLLQELLDEQVRVRKVPRQIITFAPTRDDVATPGRVPQFGVDFGLGDAVTFRAVEPATGSVRVNASLRVYAVDLTQTDDQGAVVPAFTLTAD